MTITLSDETHRALKEASVQQHQSIAAIIEEALIFRGIKTRAHARDLVKAARARSQLSEAKALALVTDEARKVRQNLSVTAIQMLNIIV